MHLAVVDFALACEAEARFGFDRSGQERGGVAADFGAVLEAVARATADQQDIIPARVEIDQEIAV